jgi:hypothetical protein
MQPTIDQAMTNLKTVFGRLLSDSNKSAEGTKSVAEEIMKLADTIEQNKPGIIELFTEIISLAGKAARAIGNIGQSLQGWGAVKRGELGIGEFATMGPDDLKKWLAANDTEEKRIQNQIAKLQKKREGAILPHYRAPIDREIADLEAKLQKARETGSTADNYAPPFARKPGIGGGGAGKEKKGAGGKSEAEKLFEKGEQAIQQLEREKTAVGDVTEEEKILWEISQGKYKDLSASQKERLVAIASEIDSLKTQNEAEKEIIKNWEENEKTIEGLREQAATIDMTESQVELYKLSLKDATDEQMAAASATLADIEQKKALKQILEDIRSPYQDYLDKIATANSLLVTGQLSIEDYTLYMSKLSEEMEKLTDKGKDQFEELKDAIEGWGKDSAQAIADFAIKGSTSFSDMAESIIADLMKMMIYQNITGPLFSSAGSGITGVLGSLFGGGGAGYSMGYGEWTMGLGFHNGGRVGLDNPTFVKALPSSMFDSARRFHTGLNPDEFPAILQKGETVIPKNGAGKGVTVNVFNNAGAQVSTSSKSDGNGDVQIDVMIDAAVAKKMSTFGSKSNKALRSNFGAKEVLTNR